jgi:hypothetical protein
MHAAIATAYAEKFRLRRQSAFGSRQNVRYMTAH